MKNIPRYPLLFMQIIITSLLITILIKLVNPIYMLRKYKLPKIKQVDENKLKKTILYINVILGFWPWKRLKNFCLVRSLILFYFSRKVGLETVINFGVTDANPSLTGHAWLSLENKAYLDCEENLHSYKLVFSWPS